MTCDGVTYRSLRGSWSACLGLAVLAVLLAAAGCGGRDSQSAAATTARYDMKGKVVAVDPAGKRVTVDHEAIPGFMAAMTMAYPVRDGRLLEKLAPGDRITAKVVSENGAYWLEEIAVTK